jgi:hypothetical protein
MKKLLYLFFGILVAGLGAFLIVIWFVDFMVVLRGLLGPMIILAGAIVFIVGLMTPFKEEDLFADDADGCGPDNPDCSTTDAGITDEDHKTD